jgi:predicted small metal-binding protein
MTVLLIRYDTNCIFTLSYNSIEDIINHIENEKKNIGSINYDLINKVKNHLNVSSEIYNIDYYDE